MKKKVQEVIRQTIKQSFLEYSWIFLKLCTVVALILFLYKNISTSQSIAPLYFTLFDNEKATVRFLQSIESLPEFSRYLTMAKRLFGEQIEQGVYKEMRDRQQTIARLETLLQRNPKARDVLYSLSLLYKVEGDEDRAERYLQQAREVDPMVGR